MNKQTDMGYREMDSANSKRYVIHEHSTKSGIHWDLMLEEGDRLVTWRLEAAPEIGSNNQYNATKITDHDMRFLSYEGPVQNNTGNVRIVDEGTYSVLESRPEKTEVVFSGERLLGAYIIEHVQEARWLLKRKG